MNWMYKISQAQHVWSLHAGMQDTHVIHMQDTHVIHLIQFIKTWLEERKRN
jgi:hypothetical protein